MFRWIDTVRCQPTTSFEYAVAEFEASYINRPQGNPCSRYQPRTCVECSVNHWSSDSSQPIDSPSSDIVQDIRSLGKTICTEHSVQTGYEANMSLDNAQSRHSSRIKERRGLPMSSHKKVNFDTDNVTSCFKALLRVLSDLLHATVVLLQIATERSTPSKYLAMRCMDIHHDQLMI
jgi:hypothetical protein